MIYTAGNTVSKTLSWLMCKRIVYFREVQSVNDIDCESSEMKGTHLIDFVSITMNFYRLRKIYLKFYQLYLLSQEHTYIPVTALPTQIYSILLTHSPHPFTLTCSLPHPFTRSPTVIACIPRDNYWNFKRHMDKDKTMEGSQ